MKRTSSNLTSHEIIGLRAFVTACSDPSLEGVSGKIIDESKNMLKLDVDGRIKTIAKRLTHFNLTLPDQNIIAIEGNAIQGRPEDRISKLVRRR